MNEGCNEAKPRTIIKRALELFNLSKELEDVIVKSKILPSEQVDEFLESDSTVRVIKEHFKIPVGGDFPSPCSRAIIVGLSTIKENAHPVIKGTEKKSISMSKNQAGKATLSKASNLNFDDIISGKEQADMDLDHWVMLDTKHLSEHPLPAEHGPKGEGADESEYEFYDQQSKVDKNSSTSNRERKWDYSGTALNTKRSQHSVFSKNLDSIVTNLVEATSRESTGDALNRHRLEVEKHVELERKLNVMLNNSSNEELKEQVRKKCSKEADKGLQDFLNKNGDGSL